MGPVSAYAADTLHNDIANDGLARLQPLLCDFRRKAFPKYFIMGRILQSQQVRNHATLHKDRLLNGYRSAWGTRRTAVGPFATYYHLPVNKNSALSPVIKFQAKAWCLPARAIKTFPFLKPARRLGLHDPMDIASFLFSYSRKAHVV